MKRTYLIMLIAAFTACLSFSLTTELSWLTDAEQAKASAAEKNSVILLSFQGSDWCGSCMKLEKSLFESDEFKVFSESKLVLLKADFPMKKGNKLSKEQTAHNEELAAKFNTKGAFPLVVILNDKGEKIGEMTHPLPSAKAYIDNLKMIIK